MSLVEFNDERSGLSRADDLDQGIHRVETSAVAILNRSEIETQIDAAHRHPRSIRRFLKEAETLATLTEETAQACIYALPRGETVIRGESVRLAEICASAYGNLHAGARVIEAEDKEVVAQGVAWDIEKNVRITVEARRRITDKRGRRYNDDMITMTGNAAASIGLRNAIFRVIPRAYVRQIYEAARKVAVGDAKTLADKRANGLRYFATLGVTVDRVLVRVGKPSVEDVGLDELEILLGLMNAIRHNEITVDEAFPVVKAASSPGGLEAAAKTSPTATPTPTTSAGPDTKPEPSPAKPPKSPTPEQTSAYEAALATIQAATSLAAIGRALHGKWHPAHHEPLQEAGRRREAFLAEPSDAPPEREPGED